MAGQAGGQDAPVVPRARAASSEITADAFTGGTCPSADITRLKAETGLLLSRLSTNVWLRAAELAFRAVARRRGGERRGPDVSRFYATLRAAVRVGTIHG